MSPGRVCRAAAASRAPHCRPPVAVLSSLDARTDHFQGMLIPTMTSGTIQRPTLSCPRVPSPGPGQPTPPDEPSTPPSSSPTRSPQHTAVWMCDLPQQLQREGTAGAATTILSLSRNSRRSKTLTMGRATSAFQTLARLRRRIGSSRDSRAHGPVLGNPT